MHIKKGISLVLLMVVLMLAIGCESTSLLERSRTISVQGVGKVTVSPDIASFSITVSELAETTREAQLETNEKVGQLLTMIRNVGVEDKDLATTALEFYPEYRWKENEQILLGQRVRQTIHVTVRGIGDDSALLGQLIDVLGTVTNISMSSIQFSKEDTSVEYAESRVLAMQKAMQKASEYAQAAGMKLGKPLSVSDYSASDYQGAVRNTMAKSAGAPMMMESMAVADVPTGELDISSSVSVVFELL